MPVLFGVVIVTFLMLRLIPGDPVLFMLSTHATQAQIDQLRRQLGLNLPIWAQFWHYLDGLVHGNLGTSYVSDTPVRDEIFGRLPADIELILASLVVALLVGLTQGWVAARWRGRAPDRVVRAVVSLEQSFPDFVVGLLLIYLLFFRLHLLPSPTGQLAITETAPTKITGMIVLDALLRGEWSTFGDALAHLVLPAVSLGLVLSAIFAKVVRSALSTELAAPQIEFARACGLRERRVTHYAWTVVRTPFLTYVAIVVGTLLGGTAIIEKVFDWNGVAQWGIASITQLDLPATEGFIVVLGVATVFIYLALDVIVILLDPRVRAS